MRKSRRNYDPMTPLTTRDILGLVGIGITTEQARELTLDERKAAADWAYAKYMCANDINIKIPPRPEIINNFPEARSIREYRD